MIPQKFKQDAEFAQKQSVYFLSNNISTATPLKIKS